MSYSQFGMKYVSLRIVLIEGTLFMPGWLFYDAYSGNIVRVSALAAAGCERVIFKEEDAEL